MREKNFSIGRLSRHTGVNIETIRYYEHIGLLPAPARTQGGHRSYDLDAARRLNFIKRSRALGFSLADIRSLLGLNDNEPSCGEVMSLTRTHLEGVRAKIADLKRLEQTLSRVVAQCEGGDDPACPVIEALSGETR